MANFSCVVARHVVTCGADEDVHMYSDLRGVAEDDVQEFSVSTSSVSALACYRNTDGLDVIALGMDDNTVQAFSTEVSQSGRGGILISGKGFHYM